VIRGHEERIHDGAESHGDAAGIGRRGRIVNVRRLAPR
jgi:hypothetical protein